MQTRLAFNSIEIPKISIVFWWNFIVFILECCNYATYMRKQYFYNSWTSDLVNAYLAFIIISGVAFAVAVAPLLLMAYKYAETERDRAFYFKLGITIMYFAGTMPLFFIELWAVKLEGMIGILQGVCFILELVGWLFASWIVWFFWMSQVSKWIFERNGYGREVAIRRKREEMFRSGQPDMWQSNVVPVTNPLPGRRDWAV